MPADYNIPMSDAQITEALQLMVERVSEGWAQETFDGSPVGSGSPYYHKSSKWWATQAADAAARAEAAVPAGTAGAVFFDRTQTLTDAQAMQARANIVAGGSNPNLIMNPWFTVNQRGVNGSVANQAFGVDMWKHINNGGGSCSMQTGQITLTQRLANIDQKIEAGVLDALAGKSLTASIMFADGTIKAGTATMPAVYTNGQTVMDAFLGDAELRLFYGTTFSFVRIFPKDANGTITMKAVKLEIGSVSTLANDAPPNYAEELAKCQYYFNRIKVIGTSGYTPFVIGYASATNAVTALYPCEMRKITSVTFSGAMRAYRAANNESGVISAISAPSQSTHTITLSFTTSANYMTQGELIFVQTYSDATAYIDLSADL